MKLPFFGKKKGGGESKGRGYVPTDRTLELMGRGFSEIDTIDVLRREGFSPDEIDKALESTIKQGAVGMAAAPPPQMLPSTTAPGETPGFQSLSQAYEQSQQPAPVFPPRKEQSPAEKRPEPEFKLPTIEELAGRSKVDALAVPETSLPVEYYQGYPTEEYIDYVVQEHMGEINKKLDGFSILYKELERRVAEVNERLKDTSKVRSGTQQQIINRIDSFNETLNDVNMRVAGVEKAFKETLPALIESVRALSDIVQRMKREA